MRDPEQVNTQKQKVDWQLSGLEEVNSEEYCLMDINAYEVLFRGDESVFKQGISGIAQHCNYTEFH